MKTALEIAMEKTPLPAAVKYVASIRNNETEEIREKELTAPVEDFPHTVEHFWDEGNFSCDCNRSVFFSNDPDEPQAECSDGRYSVNLSTNGEIFYKEF